MYTRPPTQGGSRGMRIPRNYSGNAFAPTPQEPTLAEEPAAEDLSPPLPASEEVQQSSAERDPPPSENAKPVSALFPSPSFRIKPTGLLERFGSEELLILGLILLLSGSDSSNDLLLLLLVLLLVQ